MHVGTAIVFFTCFVYYIGESSFEVKIEPDIIVHQPDHKLKPCLCLVCDKRFAGKKWLETHEQTHTGEVFSYFGKSMNAYNSRYPCAECGKCFFSKRALSKHRQDHRSGEKLHKCTVCHKGFATLVSLKTHRGSRKKAKRHKCIMCDKAFSGSKSLNSHMLRAHADSMEHAEHPQDDMPYLCTVCGEWCTTKTLLKIHERTHVEKKFECCLCKKHFFSQNLLKNHMNVHGTEYKCTECGIGSSSEKRLSRHMKVHSDEYMCAKCGKHFRAKHVLKAHEQIHSGEKPFECTVCSK